MLYFTLVRKHVLNKPLLIYLFITAVLSNLNSANALFQQLDIFKNLCRIEVNSSKTDGMWIGSLKSNDEKPFGINWPSEPIKASGVFFTYDQ